MKFDPDGLLQTISDGLSLNGESPIAWLKSFVDDLAEQQGLGVVAYRSDLPPEITLLDKPPVAIVADCGTGETKILLYTMDDGNVRFKQLMKLGPASSYFTNPDEFVTSIKGYFEKYKADIVLVAASHWMRDASQEIAEQGNDLLQQLTDAVVISKTLGRREEAWLELVAAEHACDKLGLCVDATWAAGGGSTQVTQNSKEIYTFGIGNKEGLELLKSHGTRDGLKRWREQVKNIYKSSTVRLSGCVLGISAVSHAAKACGLKIGESIARQDVLQSFDNFIERQLAANDICADTLLDLANVAQQRETMDILVSEGASLYFVREIGDESARIRVTWSLGWYLELLTVMGQLTLPYGSLKRLRADKAELGKLGSEFSSANGKSDAATMGQIVSDLEEAADALQKRARKFDAEMTDKLRTLAERNNSRLEGENYRLKTGESLERKLKQRLRRLVEMHRSHKFYSPRLADVFHEVDDALRYTVVVQDKAYAVTTSAILEALKVDLPSTYVYFNYWAEGSTYRGINAFIKCQNFTFELQFHTESSWKTKQTLSHEIYEGYRALPAGRAKHVLYEHMKLLWNLVPLPPSIEQMNQPEPMRDSLMEQFGKIQRLKQNTGGSALRILDGGAFDNDVERSNALSGLGCRLIRGNESSHFETLAFSSEGKRLAWISDLSKVELVKDRREAIVRLMGKPAEWVNKKLDENYSWKLLLMPMQVCQLANWDGVFKSIRVAYPEVASKVMKFSSPLRETPFIEIQAQLDAPSTFRKLKDAGKSHPRYVDLQRLNQIAEPTLLEVRTFLYISLGLNENFKGDGFTYDDAGVRQGAEYLLPNTEIANIPGCEVFDL